MFSHRLKLVAEKTITFPETGITVSIYYMFGGTDMTQIQQIVFAIPHPELFHRMSTIVPAANKASAACLIAERFLDVATLIAVGQVPRPTFLSCSGNYYRQRLVRMVVPIAAFTKTDGSVQRIIHDKADAMDVIHFKFHTPVRACMKQTGRFVEGYEHIVLRDQRQRSDIDGLDEADYIEQKPAETVEGFLYSDGDELYDDGDF